ncbi:MAG: hypothetical protein VX044_03665 [Planctomycetota bacterium]|nr:hypothetical protein [Planctomycetota bacterium]
MHGGHDASTGAAPALRRFAFGLRRRHIMAAGGAAGVRAALLTGVPVVAIGWLSPRLLPHAAAVSAGVVVVVAVVAAARAWRRARGAALTLSMLSAEASGDGQVFRDELATWLELDRRAARAPAGGGRGTRGGMIGWLEREVHARLQPERRGAERAASALRIGRWRWLLPLVAALLLAWLLSAWLQPPWAGLVGGRPRAAQLGATAGAEVQRPEATEATPPLPQGEEPSDEQRPGSAPAPDGDDESSEVDDPEEVPPLVDAPDDQRFVLPDFIGDGPTRRERMHVAELEQPRASGASRRPAPAASLGDGAPPARSSAAEFERAAEQALRARHVPAAERAIVRRFFEELKKRGTR